MKLKIINESCAHSCVIKFDNPFLYSNIYGQLALNNCCNKLFFAENEIFIDSSLCRINDYFYYSISHTNEYAFAAVSIFKIGIDCLKAEKRIAEVKERFLINKELEIVGSNLFNLTKAFTIKEAAIKCFNIPLLDLNKIILTKLGNIYSTFSYEKKIFFAYHDIIEDHIFTLVRKL